MNSVCVEGGERVFDGRWCRSDRRCGVGHVGRSPMEEKTSSDASKGVGTLWYIKYMF